MRSLVLAILTTAYVAAVVFVWSKVLEEGKKLYRKKKAIKDAKWVIKRIDEELNEKGGK